MLLFPLFDRIQLFFYCIFIPLAGRPVIGSVSERIRQTLHGSQLFGRVVSIFTILPRNAGLS